MVHYDKLSWLVPITMHAATQSNTVQAFTHCDVDLLSVLSSGVESLTGVLELMLKRDALRLGPRESCFDSIENSVKYTYKIK